MLPYDTLSATQDLLAGMVPHLRWPESARALVDLEEGYAVPVDDHGLIAFQEVESHVDGAGWALLILVQGAGTFELVDEHNQVHRIPLDAGAAVLFDNCQEHAFVSKDGNPCFGLSLDHFGSQRPDIETVKAALRSHCEAHYALLSPVSIRAPRA